MLPVVADLGALLERLATEERARRAELAALEERLRRFEDVERPAYSEWLRLTLGPALTALEARYEELRVGRVMAERVAALVDLEGRPPREALYMVRHPEAATARAPRDRMDPDEVAARRRAKVERKRAERKAARSTAARPAIVQIAGTAPSGDAARARILSLYRSLARRLHPDSPTVIRSLEPSRLRTVWAEVQIAYHAGNLERLLSIAAWLEIASRADGDPDENDIVARSLSERYEDLRALVRSARTLERRLAQLASDPAWEFSNRPAVDRRRLRDDAARALDDELAGVAEALAAVQAFFDAIGSPRPPRGKHRR